MAQQTPPEQFRVASIDGSDARQIFQHNLRALRLQFQKALLDANECMLATEWQEAAKKLLVVVDVMLQEKALVSQEMERIAHELKKLEDSHKAKMAARDGTRENNNG